MDDTPIKPVKYGFWDDPLKFCHLLFADRPVYSADPRYDAAVRDGNAYVAEKPTAEISSSILLAYAERHFDKTSEDYRAVVSKLEHLLNLAVAVVSGLVGFAGTMGVYHWALIPGFLILGFSLLVLFFSRRCVEIPNAPNIHKIRSAIGRVQNPEDWIANILHQAERAQAVLLDIRSGQLDAALGSLVLGAIYLVATITYLGRGP